MALENQSELVQQYVNGEMDPETAADFEQMLRQSPELAAAVRQERTLRLVIQHRELFSTVKMLDKIKAENPIPMDFSADESIRPFSQLLKSWWIKPSVKLLLFTIMIVGCWVYQQQVSKNKYNLLITNILSNQSAANILGLDTSSSKENIRQLVKAMHLYDARQYAQVIPILNQPLFKYEADAQFYLAISYLHTSQATFAEPIFRALCDNAQEKSIIYSEARQYLPVALIANGKIEEAKRFCETLSSEEQKIEPAKTLLENF